MDATLRRVLVGLSGGADSVALLRLLLDSGREVSAVHVNHGLRGAEADGDEAFARELCAALELPLLVYRAVPPPHPGEDWARRVRYGFFRQAMAASGAQALVLAHHRDDQAETLLLHLLRGAGLTGLCGMSPDTEVDGMRVVRPLLGCSREALREYLISRSQPWREDASNTETRYLRNAVRHELLPLMERLAPGAALRLANTGALLAEDEQVLSALTANFLADHPGDALPLAALRIQPAGLQKRILRAWWSAAANPAGERSLSSAQTETLCALMDAPVGSRCNLPADWHGQVGWSHLHLMPPGAAAAIAEMLAMTSPLLEILPYAGDHGNGLQIQAIPRSWLTACTVRSRRRGDEIRPFGGAGTQSLQDYLTNHRVDAPFRDRVPLFCRGSEVLLVGGVGAGAVPPVNEIDDPVLLRWKDAFPWQPGTQK